MFQPQPITIIDEPAPAEAVLKQCQHCSQILPASKFTGSKRQWCIYCVADETAANRDNTLRLKAQELSKRLMNTRNAAQQMASIEEIYTELDISLGGARGLGTKMGEVITGLLEKNSLSAAGQLLVQLMKLRFLVQRQHTEDDFTQLDLEQKHAKVQLLITQMLLEQVDTADKQELLKIVAASNEVDNDALDQVTTMSP